VRLFPRKNNNKIKDTSSEQIGGFAFYLSLVLLLPTSILFFRIAISQIRHSETSSALLFTISLCAGMYLAHRLIRDHLSVLIHEWKHEVISNLVGNRNKKMEINQNSGSLQYEYTKRTAHFNAFIALAPYILPVFTFLGALICFAINAPSSNLGVIIIGLAYGIDLLLNARDISPIQTDISQIRGGYGIGLTYILVWNLLTLSLALAWAFNGASGIAEQFVAAFQIFVDIYSGVTGWRPGGEQSLP
jgi:hypothetical protein